MLGAIFGDVVGSRFEWNNIKSKNFELLVSRCEPTDDSVMTCAVAESILSGEDPVAVMQRWGRDYPGYGYGSNFVGWIYSSAPAPYNSWGNGSGMRTSPVGWLFGSLEETLAAAEKYSAVTHNHPEGIKGAQAVSAAIYLARTGSSKEQIAAYLRENFYALDFTLDEIRPSYGFDVSCQGSVPQALQAFLESTDFEDAIRSAISIGGDSDTIAAMTGAVAEAFYGIPDELIDRLLPFVDERMMDVVRRFGRRTGLYPRLQ
ncbi:MAG: ADP-ribosylglycohydrolase [Ruminococcaceae bacterium]|nr:ADP-ribosylglycohydrolase [Oscillospiraceae bacterium]